MQDDRSPLQERGTLDKLEDRLDSRTGNLRPRIRRSLENETPEVATDWEHDENEPKLNLGVYYDKHRKSTLKWLLIGAGAFFVVSVGFAGYMFLGAGRNFTGDNLNITIAGPVATPGGEELPLDIVVDNQNPTDLEAVSLTVDYPPGTRKSGDLSTDFSRHQEELGAISAGQSVKRRVSAVLFGESNSTAQIKISVEYRVPGSSAVFLKQKEYQIMLSSSPVAIVIDSPQTVVSGQPFILEVAVNSNASTVIENLMLKAEYGFGYAFVSSEPATIAGNDAWSIGDLKPGDKRIIKIRGTISGQNDEQRTLRFSVGTQDPNNPRNMQTKYLMGTKTLTVSKPYVSADLAINGDTAADTYVVSGGSGIRGDIAWKNNSAKPVANLQITAALSGLSFDRTSVSTSGYYRSIDDQIIWDSNRVSKFVSLPAGAEGSESFSVGVLDYASLISMKNKNPKVGITVKAVGTYPGNTGPQAFESSVTKTVKITTQLAVNPILTYYAGPFTNTGPLPPKADKETTYTVTWKIANAVNDASNVIVTGRLPAFVRFVGPVSPSTEKVTYNPIGATVTWNVGPVQAFTGFSGPTKEVSFQVAFLPSVTQVNSSPIIVDGITISGSDDFTNATLTDQALSLTTTLENDPQARSFDSTVSR